MLRQGRRAYIQIAQKRCALGSLTTYLRLLLCVRGEVVCEANFGNRDLVRGKCGKEPMTTRRDLCAEAKMSKALRNMIPEPRMRMRCSGTRFMVRSGFFSFNFADKVGVRKWVEQAAK